MKAARRKYPLLANVDTTTTAFALAHSVCVARYSCGIEKEKVV